MKEIIWKPELHRFSSCKEFVEEFRLGASDLILTNEYIYQPYFRAMNLECACCTRSSTAWVSPPT